MTDREKLPGRRAATTIEIQHEGAPMTITIGRHDDGRVARQRFQRHSTPLESLARDAAILVSLAIQHGAPLDTLRAAVTRDTLPAEGFGEPSSLIGAVLDGMAKGA